MRNSDLLPQKNACVAVAAQAFFSSHRRAKDRIGLISQAHQVGKQSVSPRHPGR